MLFGIANYLRVWAYDSARADSPHPQVNGTVGIGIGGEPAQMTRKFVACWPVLLTDAPTGRTGPTGIAGINKFNRHSEQLAFVSYLRSKISEGPRVQDLALRFSNPYPRSDARQIFEDNTTLRAFGNNRNFFGDDVINVTHKSLLASAQSAQDSLGGFGAFGLKALPLTPSAIANASDLSGIPESLTIGTFGEIGQPKVNSNPINRFTFQFFWHFNRHVQKPLRFSKDQRALALFKLEKFALLLAAYKWNCFTPANCPNIYGRCGEVKRKNPAIVRNTPQSLKLSSRFLIQLIGIGNFSNQPNYWLSSQCWKLISNLPVIQLVDRKPTKFFLFPSQFRQAIGGIVDRFQREAQLLSLLSGRQEFNLDDQLQRYHF